MRVALKIKIDLGWLKVFTKTSRNQLRALGILAVIVAYIVFIFSDVQPKDGAILSLVTNAILTLALGYRPRRRKT